MLKDIGVEFDVHTFTDVILLRLEWRNAVGITDKAVEVVQRLDP
jgi:hypothetical protein